MGSISSVGDVFRAIRRRWAMVVAILLIGTALTLYYVTNMPRLYEATALVQIEAPDVTETLSGGAPVQRLTTDSQLDLIQQRLMARDSMHSIVEQYDLFPAVASDSLRVDLLREAISVVKLIDPAQAWRPDVQPSGLSITVKMDTPELSAEIANEALNRIVAEAQRRSSARADLTLSFFSEEERRVGDEIAEAAQALALYQAEHAASLPSAIGVQREHLAELNDRLIGLEQDLIELQNGSSRLRADEAARQTEEISQQRALIEQNIARAREALAAAPEVERQIGVYEQELGRLRDEYSVITTRRTEAAMNQLLESQDRTQRLEILETAIVPENSIGSSRKKIAAAGVVASTILALLAALAMGVTDRRIRTAAQLERELGVKPVMVLPRLKKSTWRRRRRRAPAARRTRVPSAGIGQVSQVVA